MSLLNVYAPTTETTNGQIELLDQLIPIMQKYSCRLVLGGDLNTIFSELDKHPKGIKITNFATRLQLIMDDFLMRHI
jgi:hypothetical protein